MILRWDTEPPEGGEWGLNNSLKTQGMSQENESPEDRLGFE